MEDSISNHKIQLVTVAESIPVPSKLKIDRQILYYQLKILPQHILVHPMLHSPESIKVYTTLLEKQLKEAISNSSRPIPESPVPWWNEKLTLLKKNPNKGELPTSLLIKWLDHLNHSAYCAENKSLTVQEVNSSAKISAWRKFTSQNKAWGLYYVVLKKTNTTSLGNLQRGDGRWTTTTEETSELLLSSKFPEDYNYNTAHLLEGSPSVPLKITSHQASKKYTQQEGTWPR